MKAAILAALVLIPVAHSSALSAVPTATVGSKIRIRTVRTVNHCYGTRSETTGWQTGLMANIDGKNLHVVFEGAPDTVAVDRASIIAAQVWVGTETHEDSGKFFGGVLGGVAGAVIGGAVGRGQADQSGGLSIVSGGVAGLIAGSKAGYGAGGGIGRGMQHGRWEDVQAWPYVTR